MLNPYKIIAQTEESVTFQYNTYHSWILVVILVLLAISLSLDNPVLGSVLTVLMAAYLISRLYFGRKVIQAIRQALKSGAVEVSGGKYSIARPMTIKIPRRFVE